MSPRGRLPSQQGRQGGFANTAFAAERDFHDASLTARPNARNCAANALECRSFLPLFLRELARASLQVPLHS
jgi:hypothetical protein